MHLLTVLLWLACCAAASAAVHRQGAVHCAAALQGSSSLTFMNTSMNLPGGSSARAASRSFLQAERRSNKQSRRF
jgi:hypothetical protein